MLRPSFADKFRIRPTAYGFFHKYSGRNLETVLRACLNFPIKSYFHLAGEVYIRRRMQYISNRSCSIYPTAHAVYIHFPGACAAPRYGHI